MSKIIPMSSNTTEVRCSRVKFEQILSRTIGYTVNCPSSLIITKVDGISQFTINTYPYLGQTNTHIVGQWAHGRGTYCNKALLHFKV